MRNSTYLLEVLQFCTLIVGFIEVYIGVAIMRDKHL